MSLQSTSNIWKWNFTAANPRGAYLIAIFALLLAIPHGYSQTTGTRTALSAATEAGKTTLSVTVKDPTGAAVSDGTVSFVSNGQSLGSAFVQENGTATLTLDKIPANAKQITAVYSGSNSHAASTSANVSLQANATSGPPDFSISANATSLSLTAGEYGTVILTVTPLNGFTQSVTMSISGLPIGTTAVFTPTIVTPTTAAAVPSTLQIQTTASSKSSQNQALPFGNHTSHIAYAVLFPGVLALVGIGALRKRSSTGLRLFGVALLLLACTSGLTACSQRYSYLHHPPAANPGTPAGNYTLTVTAYSNNGGEVTSHPLQLAMTVK
jgi:hypothetical protein